MNRPDDSPKKSILIYITEDSLTKIDTTFDGDTVWLSIDQMADLFQRDKSTISRHIKNIFAEGELESKNEEHIILSDDVFLICFLLSSCPRSKRHFPF